MNPYFAKEYTGHAFELFGPAHLVALAVTLLAVLGLAFAGPSMPAGTRRSIRFGLAALLIANEIAWHAWTLATDQWSARKMLPLHMCSVTSLLSIFMLFRPSVLAYEFVYFLGISGAGHTLLTPDVGPYGFPHIRFFITILGHAGIVLAAAYLTFVERFRPTWASFRRVAVWGNLYLVAIFFLNLAIGSNYMYVVHKPETKSLMDLMGPWPWYVLVLEVVALLHMLLLYAPFAVADARRRAMATTGCQT